MIYMDDRFTFVQTKSSNFGEGIQYEFLHLSVQVVRFRNDSGSVRVNKPERISFGFAGSLVVV